MQYISFMRITQLSILAVCVSTLAGCGVSDSDEIKRTYPEAFDFETVGIQQLLNEVETPDSVNIEPFIFGISYCPENATCFLPDGIWISDSLPPNDTLFIATAEPRQFQENRQYTVSLYVDKKKTTDYPDLHILGYTVIK